jgi:hypothetical protein
MGFLFNKKLFFISTYFIFVSAWFLLLQLNPNKETYFNYLINPAFAFIYFFAGFTSFTAGRTIGPSITMGKALQAIGLGCFSYTAALLIWTAYTFFLGDSIPYPSLADVFFILFIPCILYGVLHILSLYGSIFSLGGMFKAVFVATIAFSIIFYFVVLPTLSKDAPLPEIFFDLLYPISDFVLMLIAAVGITLSGGTYRKSLTLISFALLFQVAGDFFFSYRTSHSLYWNGDFSDYLFTISAFLLVLAVHKLIHTHNKYQARKK